MVFQTSLIRHGGPQQAPLPLPPRPPPPPPAAATAGGGRGRVRVRLRRLMKHRTNGVLPRQPIPQYSLEPPKEIEEAQDVFEELERLDSDTKMSVPDHGMVDSEEPLKRWGCDSASVSQQIKEFEDDLAGMERQMHGFPPLLSDFRRRFSEPVAVVIGHSLADLHLEAGRTPYQVRLFDGSMMTAKNVAMHHFRLGTTFGSVEEMSMAFFSAIRDVNDDDDSEDNDDDDKASAWYNDPHALLKFDMLRDGCFLLEYMQHVIGPDDSMPKLLVSYFQSNVAAIDRDIMLLENQLPWVVIKVLGEYKEHGHMVVKTFVGKMARTLQVRRGPDDSRLPDLEGKHSPSPSHLLGLLRSYKIGYDDGIVVVPIRSDGTSRPMSRTINVIELAEIGIKLTASKTTRFIDMGLKKTLLGAEIFLAPLLLDETRQCWLVNMAAFELCVAPYASSSTNHAEKFAVRAYIIVFAMLMDREEDVHALRSKGLIQGELTNKQILDFFKELVRHISGGPLYTHLMEEIEDYKIKRWVWIKLYKFIYKNYRTIVALLSIVGVLAGIFKTLLSLKQH